jgi:hypothetical protein
MAASRNARTERLGPSPGGSGSSLHFRIVLRFALGARGRCVGSTESLR